MKDVFQNIILDDNSALSYALCAKDARRYLDFFDTQRVNIRYLIELKGIKHLNASLPVISTNFLEKCDELIILTEKDYAERLKEITKNRAHKVVNIEKLFSVKDRNCLNGQLYMESNGNLYPCCKVVKKAVIGNIFKDDLKEKLVNYRAGKCSCAKGRLSCFNKELPIKNLSVELGGECNAACFYCFQSGRERTVNRIPVDKIEDLVAKLNIESLTVAGGELLCQRDVLMQLKEFKLRHKNIELHLKTNGCAAFTDAQKVSGIFDFIHLTFNGFSATVNEIIMGTRYDFMLAKTFTEEIAERAGQRVTVKYLISPLNVIDLPAFLEFALKLPVARIDIKTANIYSGKNNNASWNGSSFERLNNEYWAPVFERVSAKAKAAIAKGGDVALNIDSAIERIMKLKSSER